MRRPRAVAVLLVLLAAALVAWALRWVADSFEERRREVAVLRAQLEDLGVEPKVGPAGEAGERGEQGPRGERGEKGETGRPPTATEIAAVVADWFTLNPPVDQPDPNDPEIQDAEVQDAEVEDAEVDDPDPDDPEVQDPEIQDPEVDDPDPAMRSFSYPFGPWTFTCTDPDGDGHYDCTRDEEVRP